MTTEQDALTKPQKFRSPYVVAIWWLWALFAAGNLIDIAAQGRDHSSVVAAFVLLLITGVVEVATLRPRIVTDSGGLTIINPLREHRVVWAAVAGIDSAELLRVRCQWPLDDGTGGTGTQAISSWAVHASRRRQAAARMRAQRRAARAARGGGGRSFGGFGAPVDIPSPPPATTAADADHVITTLNALTEQSRAAAPDQPAVPPVSRWSWTALATIILPALALLIAVLI